MSSSKTKRTVTVEKSTSDSSLKSKPSVFDRLGAPHSYGSSERQEICIDFANTGTCSYGSKCKYSHVPVKRERDREKERGSDDLRSRVSRKRDDNEGEQDSKKSASQRKEKESKIKSTVVVTKSSENIDDIWPEPSEADKGFSEHKHESKTRQQGSSSTHGAEAESHKSSTKYDNKADDRNEEGSGQHSSRGRNKSPKSPSHLGDDASRRKSKDKKKKKRTKSQESPSPDRAEDKQDAKHPKESLSSSKVASEKHSKSSSDSSRRVDTSSSATSLPLDKKQKSKDSRDDKSKPVEKRLLMLAMESNTPLDSGKSGRVRTPTKTRRDPSPSLSRTKDSRKDVSSPSSRSKDGRRDRAESPPSKSQRVAKDRSASPVKESRREPSPSKDRSGGKPSHSKSQTQLSSHDKPRRSNEAKLREGQEKLENRVWKAEKGKTGSKRRHSTSSSASSSSSSSSGSDSGSSTSSSSGSSSSSSSSSDATDDERKLPKNFRGGDSKSLGERSEGKAGRRDDGKTVEKISSKHRKEDRVLQTDSRSRRDVSEKEKNRGLDPAPVKDSYARRDASPERSRKKDWEKDDFQTGPEVGYDVKKGRAPSVEHDKKSRDNQYGQRTGDSLRPKGSDAVEYSKRTRSPMTKDDRVKPLTPVDMSRGLSPTDSMRNHHSTKPNLLLAEQDREHEVHYHDYYASRDKASRKGDERFPPYRDEFYSKKPQSRSTHSGYSSSQKHHAVDSYGRPRDGTEADRDDRDARYSRDHVIEGEQHFVLPTERRNAEIDEEGRPRQDYYASGYRDERRSGRTEDSARKDLDRTEKHVSNYDARELDRDFDQREREKGRDQRDYREKIRTDAGEYSSGSSSKYKKEEGHVDDSRRERTSRRDQWESEREVDDQARQGTSRSDPRSYMDKREISRKRPLEDDGGSSRSPLTKKMREGSPSESHHSYSSRTAYDRDSDRLDKERNSKRSRHVGREEDRHSGRAEGEYRERGRSERDRATEKDWELNRRRDSKDRSKDTKMVGEAREHGSEVKESWHREGSDKRKRSPGDKLIPETSERGKDWKRSRTDLDAVERDKPVERHSRRDDDHLTAQNRDRSPKPGYSYKSERIDGDKRASDSMAFVKSLDADLEGRGSRVKSEEKRDLLGKDLEPSMIPVHVDDRMRRSLSRGSLSSKHSQRDRDSRRDDRHFDDRYDPYRDNHYRDERLPLSERPFEHEERENWPRDRGYDRVRPEEEPGRPFRPPFDHDRNDREVPKGRDFGENEWEMDSFRFRGLARAPNWERERPREEWDRFDRGLDPDFRPRRDVLLPPPPRPRPVQEVRAPSPLPPPVEVLVPPPVDHLPVRAEKQVPAPVEVKQEVVPVVKSTRPSKDKDKDEDTGYDDISDGELEDLIGVAEEDKENSQVSKTGVVDILDIKWEVLVQNSVKTQDAPRSVLNRFNAAAVFRKIGVSRAFAGDDLHSQVKKICQKQAEGEAADDDKDEKKEPQEPLVKEEQERPVTIKEEPSDEATVVVKPEPVESLDKPDKTEPAPFELLDDVADFHAGQHLKSSERVGAMNYIGPYRRALCARRDLAIRRGLCKVEKEDILMFPAHVVDQDLYKQSLQFFLQDRTVEKRTPFNPAVSQRLPAVPANSA